MTENQYPPNIIIFEPNFNTVKVWYLNTSPPSVLQELQREKNSVTVQLDQSSRRLSQLEEEKKSTDQSLKRTQGLLDDLKGI